MVSSCLSSIAQTAVLDLLLIFFEVQFHGCEIAATV